MVIFYVVILVCIQGVIFAFQGVTNVSLVTARLEICCAPKSVLVSISRVSILSRVSRII